jgi:hypothetical protein
MGDSHSWKPGARPDTTPQPTRPTAGLSNRAPAQPTSANRPPSHPTSTTRPPSQPISANRPPSQPTFTNRPPSQPISANRPPSQPTFTNRPPSHPTSTTRPPSQPVSPKPAGAPPEIAGRITHDERGNAVWDWLKDTARIAIDSTSRLLRKLEVPELEVEDTQEQELRIESDRDSGGGYDPYGGSGTPPARTTYGSSTGAPGGAPAGSRGSTTNTGTSRGGSTNNSGGGYDPYGKGVTNKSTRKR